MNATPAFRSSAPCRLFATAARSLRRSLRSSVGAGLAVLLLLAPLLSAQPQSSAKSGKPVPIYDPATGKVNARVPRPAAKARPADSGGNGQSSCTLLTFEGLGDLVAIPDFQGISLPDWLSIIQDTAGGSGNFANAPSGVTIAFWLYGNPTSQNVLIPNGASSVSFYYSSYYDITVTGLDANNNAIVTATGPANFDSGTEVYDIWAPISITAPSGSTIASVNITGYANYTGMDNLNVCQAPKIAAVEMTQAIQQLQTLSDLKTSLQQNNEPPVPLIANKPAVLRTYFQPVQDVTNVTVRLSGVDTQTKSLSLIPNCSTNQQRANANSCSSLDFYFTPPGGSWQAQLDVLDDSGNSLESEMLPVTSRSTNTLNLQGVSVCDAKDAAGAWLCSDASDLLARTGLISKITPAATVNAGVSSSVIRNDIAAIVPPTGVAVANAWWNTTTASLGALYGTFNAVADAVLGQRTTYFGMVRPAPTGPTATDPLGGIGGQAQNIPAFAAAGRTSALRFASNTETTVEVVAHETGHTLGLRHTNTNIPATNAAPPGCYNFASDPSTDWSYPSGSAGNNANTNYIQDSTRQEYGFDVGGHVPLDPGVTFEVMSYCSPRWISPQRYKSMIAILGGGTVSSPSAKTAEEEKDEAAARAQSNAAPASTPQAFWQVRGTITGSTATFLPLFELTAQGDTSAGTGTYSLVVEDASGTALFTRSFTPSTSTSETTGKDFSSDPYFSQLIPVTSGAAAIVLKGTGGAELGRLTLSGSQPLVTITAPANGFVGTGTQTIAWTVVGPASYSSKVLYSPDNGKTYTQVGEIPNGTSLPVDFDMLPGSTGAVIEVLVSDGVNTGTATSIPFTVPKKTPHAIYITSPTPNYAQASVDPLLLTGAAYDADDGVLTGKALSWSSNLQGALGTGSPLSASLKPGNHTLTLTATDSDGNAVTATTNVIIGGQPPVVTLTVQALNTVPTTCESATIGATPGVNGAALTKVQYSIDGGATYTSIPLNQLPYAFIVPSTGFVHVVALAQDASHQTSAQDTSFLVQSACQGESQSITFPAIAQQVYGAPPVTLNATASSGLPVSYAVTGPAKLAGSVLTITGAGAVTVTASQAGNSNYAPAAPIMQSITVLPATLTVTANSTTRAYGAPNPTLTYMLAGFVNGETSSVVSGTATLSTTATASSPAGPYPITFATEGLTAANYNFVYVPGTLTVTGGGTSQCQTINYANGFTTAGLTLNGGSTIQGNLLQLTDSGQNEARSAFYSTAVPISSFTTDFTFQLNYALADGFTFALQGDGPAQVGQGGGGLGYAGIPHSAAVKFDLFNNNGEGFDSTGVYLNGAYPSTPAIPLYGAGIHLHIGHIFAVHLAYANAMTTASITDTATGASASASMPGDLTALLGQQAYVGFTGGTGLLTATQNILTWSYSGGACQQ